MGKKYKNSPIVEAVCEFRLTTDTPWDPTIPGLFYERVKDTFPHREQRLVQEVGVTEDRQGIQHQLRLSDRLLLFTEDKKMLFQLGRHLLVVNSLKPYPTWQRFKPRIEMAWKGLQDVLEIKGLERIGLRYINQIELPVQRVELAEYFEFYPFVGPSLPQEMAGFIAGVEFTYAEGRDRCRIQLTPTPSSEDDKRAIMLDIDYFLAQPRAVEAADALDWVEKAHDQIEVIFEGCITDRLRGIFGEVK
ncbi:MAG: TIGR04255 family protein [Acidobacteria bacterium]|nr:MAG: TIGR04255 family protein [Acidobacteriota bacterium]